MVAQYLKSGHGRFRLRVSNSLFKGEHGPLFINNKSFETTTEHKTHMSKSCTVTLVAALTTSRCDRRATGCRSDASGSRGVWMTSWWVLESASPSAAWVYFNSRSRRPPSATHKRRGHLTTMYHLRNVVSHSCSVHQFVCNPTINGDCIERKRRSIKFSTYPRISLKIKVILRHAHADTDGRRWCSFNPFATSATKGDVDGRHHGYLTPWKTWYSLYRRLGGSWGPSERVRKIFSPPGFDPQIVKPPTNRYAIPANCISLNKM